MKVTSAELVARLSGVLDRDLACAAIESYVEMQQRFLAGDWQPTELDGGRLCEAVARCLLQLDTGKVDQSLLPGKIRDVLTDASRNHALQQKDRLHITKVIDLVYKLRSDRGAVHISPIHDANYMDSMLVVHAGKWMLGELLRLSLKQDVKIIGEMIAQLVQLEHSLVHELDGRPLVMAKNISAPEEVLLLLNHALNNRLTRADLIELAPNQNPRTVTQAIRRLLESKDIRTAGPDEVALTPIGQKRVMKVIIPKYGPK